MAQVKAGDKVRVHYVGSLEDGTVFDSSREGEPMEFAVGERMLIPGFEDAVIGMSAGDSKTVSIPPEDAYGSHIEELITVVERSQIPTSLEPKIGMMLQADSDDGMVVPFTVKEVTEDSVILDGNHPLAGKGLTFEIELLEIVQ
ncbi:MAG: peptidylprolyl isomerase [Deltaproteobacteria bacterium]